MQVFEDLVLHCLRNRLVELNASEHATLTKKRVPLINRDFDCCCKNPKEDQGLLVLRCEDNKFYAICCGNHLCAKRVLELITDREGFPQIVLVKFVNCR